MPDTIAGDTMTHLPTQLARKLINRANARGLLAVAICGAATLAITPASALADDDAASFWTQFAPSEDTRLIFVSSSEGNDNNSGFSPNEPVASLDKAYELLRDGYPDWMLLKRGDVWYESFPWWKKSGRNINEKLVVGAFGDSPARPQIRPDGGTNGINGWGNDTVSHVAFVGFHLEPNNRAPDQGGSGISWLKDSEDILFEDLYIDGFKDNLTLKAHGDGVSLRDFRINGCVIVDAWSNGGHSQGLYASGINGFVIENSVFDHNGWNLNAGAEPTIFNHNVYIQNSITDVVFSSNISSDASSHGVQLRGGGVARGNLFITNPLAMHIGGGTSPNPGGVTATIQRNLVMHGRDLSSQAPRAFGISLSNIRNADVSYNYMAHSNLGQNHQPFMIGGDRQLMATNISVHKNLVYEWQGMVTLHDPQGNETFENIQFFDNTIVRDLSHADRPTILRIPEEDHVAISDNAYHIYQPHDRVFRAGSVAYSPTHWLESVELSSDVVLLDAPPKEIGIEQYLQSINQSGDLHSFIQNARKLSRTSMDANYTAESVIEWFEDSISNIMH
ncbi:MAG: hypothetical protein ACX94C_08695 [Phycisphaerales bacterium]